METTAQGPADTKKLGRRKATRPAAIRVEYGDDDLRQRVSNFLDSRHFNAFRNLEINVDAGLVTISGQLNSYYEKQVALNSCRRVAGVLGLVDDIAVGNARN